MVAITAAGLLGGCGHSPPTQFFTLTPVRADAAQRSYAGSPVQVRAVHIPATLDRPERVVETTRDRLDILEQQRWGGPLADMVRRTLTEDLMTRLPAGMVLTEAAPAPPATRGIVVDIVEFQPEPAGLVVLDASWTVIAGQSGPPGPRAMRRFQLHAAGGADAEVAAMSQLLGQLADAIVQTVGAK
jgi:uncharacterized protein